MRARWIAAVACCLAGAWAQADEQAQFDFANGLFARGFNAEAAAEYRGYLQQFPDGAHRPEALYRLGESEFVRRYGKRQGFTPEAARAAWNRAADTHAAVLTIV